MRGSGLGRYNGDEAIAEAYCYKIFAHQLGFRSKFSRQHTKKTGLGPAGFASLLIFPVPRLSLQGLRGTAAEAAIKKREFDWSIVQALNCESSVRYIPDELVRGMVQIVLDRFKKEILPRLADMKCGIVHGDLNEHNILINPNQPDKVSGVLDIGDTLYAPVVADLGIALAYICLLFPESPAESTAPIVRGYLAKGSLNTLDRETLHLWVLTRLSQSISFGYGNYEKDPGNEYLLCSARPACVVLPKLFAMTSADVERVWFSHPSEI